jgi:hypothetical protein
MRREITKRFAIMLIFCVTPAAWAGDRSPVEVIQTPDGGIQPQAVIDAKGAIHLVYFKGSPSASDVFYARAEPGSSRFTAPIRVNSEAGSGVAIGTIRGAQVALGKNGRIHVAWNGSGRAKTQNPERGMPMLYTRSNDAGSAFEPERNLMTRTSSLDGGGTVAADGDGRVYVAWHGRPPDAVGGERARRFFVARSDDDGKTFAPEQPALERATGACGCCGTRAFVDRRGDFLALYRAATLDVERDMILVASTDHGAHFDGKSLHPWRVQICPMSSEAFAEGPTGVVAAWETAGQVYFSTINPQTQEFTAPKAPPGKAGARKHPALAVNDRGQMILAWAEGTGWERGGSLAWQVFDADGTPTAEKGALPRGIPVWGLPTVVARPDGSFLIMH